MLSQCYNCKGHGPLTIQMGIIDEDTRLIVQEEASICAHCKEKCVEKNRNANPDKFVRVV